LIVALLSKQKWCPKKQARGQPKPGPPRIKWRPGGLKVHARVEARVGENETGSNLGVCRWLGGYLGVRKGGAKSAVRLLAVKPTEATKISTCSRAWYRICGVRAV